MKKYNLKGLFKNLKRSYDLTKESKKYLIAAWVLELFKIPLSIITPILTAKLVLDINGELFHDLFMIIFYILIVKIILGIINYFSSIFYKKFILKTTYNVKKTLLQEILTIETKHYDSNGTGIFVDRLRGDTNTISSLFDTISSFSSQVLSDIGIFVVIFSISKIMFLFFMLVLLKEILIVIYRIKKQNEKRKEIRNLEEKNTGLITEFIRGIRDIRVLNSSSMFLNKFDSRVEEANEKSLKLSLFSNRINFFKHIITALLDFGFYALGICLVKNSLLTVPNFLILHMYRTSVSSFISYIVFILDRLNDFNFSANRLFELFDENIFSKEKFGDINLDTLKGDFEFKNLSFKYGDKKNVLKNISFKIDANSTVAFVGKSGAGKSTIFNIIEKLYSVPDNKVFIDGYDINSLSKSSIRDNISIITQSPYIFNLSIKENLLLVSDNISEKELIKACKTACIHDFIMSLPEGYDTIVGEGGITLSGGQRQRLAIARALIKKSDVILFDEATSALDNETQEKIQKAIHNLKGKHTVLIIAHRLSTIKNSDNIIMINNGKVVANGSHNELIKNSKEYYNLYHSEDEK